MHVSVWGEASGSSSPGALIPLTASPHAPASLKLNVSHGVLVVPFKQEVKTEVPVLVIRLRWL